MHFSPSTARDSPRPAFATARHGHNAPGNLRPCPVGPYGHRIPPTRAGHRRTARQTEERHMADEPVFIFPATYHTEADAQLDYAAVKELHSAGVIGTYDAAVVTLSLIHISEPTRLGMISYAVFCLKKK